ncbi:microtubule-associated protein 10 [Betta splendens]|uniref:Microtubule-associated protein 10 n=1 Tax=Betta splendens TaxID=158456 RepID=A0A9W2XA96_BETSP|nr:microtubule-associated protein 10 [Betta splendens]
MSGRHSSEHLETLFSFEILVEYVRIDKQTKVSEDLALGIRLLDFPTLLIYQAQPRSGHVKPQEPDENDEYGEYVFNRGKRCFFQMNLASLRVNLSRTPLYAMVLDVKEDIPKLVGSSMISLANVVDRVSQDVTLRGVSTPSTHGERGLVYISNLTGEKIGSVSLSYKLLSLGASLHAHIRDRPSHEGIEVQECITETNRPTELLGPDCSPTLDKSDVNVNNQSHRPVNTKAMINESQDENHVSVNDEHIPNSQIPEIPEERDNILEEDLSLFCPPYLYYTNSAEERRKAEEAVDFKLPHLDADSFPYEDSEDESTGQNEPEAPTSPVMHQQVKQSAPSSSSQQASGRSPNTLGESLRQLPLLNALLVELSQLNGQNLQQPLSVHPNLAWIYRPASAEPPAGQAVKPLPEPQNLKKLPAPRNCSTPILRPASVKKKGQKQESSIQIKSSDKSSKKLVFGITKTFNLRLKHISPSVKRRECMELIQNDTRSSVGKAKTKTKTITQAGKRNSVINHSSSLHENIETMIESVTVGSALQETITLKPNNMHATRHGKQDRDSRPISENRSLSEKGSTCIHIPTVNSDSVAGNKDKTEHHSESNQSRSDPDRHPKKIESSRSSRQSSSKSSFSDSGGEGNEDGDYADDFNSLEPSDAYSPDPVNSPEPSRAKTPKSPVCPNSNNSDSDSDSEVVQRRAVLPVPIKAPSSPQRTLRGTYVIRPKIQASALSFSSDDAKGDGSSSLQSMCSRNKVTKSTRLERTSGAESFVSSRGDRSESLKTSGPVRELSADSASSFGLQEAEELEDKLGSLDFKKEYQHISELVASRLPGYTM